MVIQERTYTTADLRALEAQLGNKDKRFELINGAIYEVPYPSPTHNLFIGNIYSPLRDFVRAGQLGYVFTDSVSYSLPNGDEFAPDVSFVLRERVEMPLPKAFSLAPDMAVEVASPSNRERELLDKAESLLECGTRFVWIAYPNTKVVDVCHLSPEGNLITRKVDIDGVLDGEEVLPGFTLAVRIVFEL
jgi:Uma2 family endonuclease